LDSLALISANFDLLLSNIITKTQHKNIYYTQCKKILTKIIDIIQNKKNFTEDDQFIYLLTKVIVLGGFAMYEHGSSQPASGSEHIMCHVYEMIHTGGSSKNQLKFTHGQLVGAFLKTSISIEQKVIAFLRQKLSQKNLIINLAINRNDIATNFPSLKNKASIIAIKAIKNQMFKINEFKKLIVLENDITLLKQAIFLLDEYIPKIDDGIEKQIKNIAHLSRERLTCLDFAIGVLLS